MKLTTVYIALVINTAISKFDISYVKLKNSCPSYNDYYTIWFNKNCYYEPDVFSSTTDILQRHVGNFETYEIESGDGFYLTVFRIPKQNPKGVIVFSHPIGSDSVIYVGQSNTSMAFVMSNAGYDVWLINNRGTQYSMKHKYLEPTSEEFWNFSYHEIALHDFPVILDFVKEKTKRSDLIVIAYSMGTSCSLVYSSLKPRHALSTVKVFILMSPIAYFKNMRSPFKYLAYILPIVKPIHKLFHMYSSNRPHNLLPITLHLSTFLPFKRTVVKIIEVLYGNSENQFDLNLINLFSSLNPRSAAKKIKYHYSQQVMSGGRFQMYDYGNEKNLELYNSSVPPEYPVENILVPMYLMTSEQDTVGTVEDSKLLFSKFRSEVKIYGNYFFEGFNHYDFGYGRDRQTKLFNPILNLLDKIM